MRPTTHLRCTGAQMPDSAHPGDCVPIANDSRHATD